MMTTSLRCEEGQHEQCSHCACGCHPVPAPARPQTVVALYRRADGCEARLLSVDSGYTIEIYTPRYERFRVLSDDAAHTALTVMDFRRAS